jgi:hypothetical protein
VNLEDGRSLTRAPFTHFAAKAKRVIVHVSGRRAQPSAKLFDHKPEPLGWRASGQLPPAELLGRITAPPSSNPIRPCSALSSLSPVTAVVAWNSANCCRTQRSIADDICLIRSMHTDAVNHAPAQILMNTGSQQFGRPSFGAWTLYGLGSESEDLPGFVVLTSAKGPAAAPATTAAVSCRPSTAASVPLHRRSRPLSVESARESMTRRSARRSTRCNDSTTVGAGTVGDPEIARAFKAYEMAFRMQTAPRN